MKIKRILSAVLCLCTLLACAPAAFADVTDAEEMKIFSDSEIESIINDYLSSRSISAEKVSIGFCYTATGDEWFMNGDEWIYPASLYKVPLMMLLAEKVSSGELTQESNIGGMSVGQIEEYIIVYSNNDWAHTIRAYLGGDEAWRAEAKKYSRLSDTDYSADYMTYCYFTARYITEVIETLYASPETFPNVIECMGQAKPGEYLRTNIEGQYTVAQKYGSYIEPNGTWNNHAAGIIYTPNPIIVTVMTRNVDNYNAVIGDIAELLTSYALTLDEKLEIFEQQKLAAQVAAEQAEADRAAAEQRAAEEAERAAAEKAAADKAAAEAAEKEAAKAKRMEAVKKVAKLGLSALAIAALAAAAIIFLGRKNKKRSPAEERNAEKYGRGRYDDELWDDYDLENGKRTPRARPAREQPVRRGAPDDAAVRRRTQANAESEAYRRSTALDEHAPYRRGSAPAGEAPRRRAPDSADERVYSRNAPAYEPRRREAPAPADSGAYRDYPAYGRSRAKGAYEDEGWADENEAADENENARGGEFERRFSQGRTARRETYDEPHRQRQSDDTADRRSDRGAAATRGRKRGRHEL